MSLKSAFRKMSRAFRAKDEASFEAAMDEVEEHLEKDYRSDDEEPDAVEIHNHIPASQIDGLGEVPPKDPPGFPEVRDEAPPWAKGIQDSLKKMGDDISALQKWAKEEGKEPEHQEDGGNLENLGEFAKDDEEEELGEMESDRHMTDRRDRRGRDETAEEEARDRRRRAGDDEANEKILGELEFEAPPGTGVKDAKKARDSAFLEESFQDTVAKAEVLAPGIRVPTFDRAAPPIRTGRSLLGLRRSALDVAYHQAETRGLIDAALSGREMKLGRMNDGQVRILFNSVAAAAMTGNNKRATDRSPYESGGGLRTSNSGARIQTLADLNARNRERFGRKTA